MGDRTNIEWADKTFNPFIGCQKVSLGCKNCYAENLAEKRFGLGVWGPTKRGVTSAQNWKQPLAWNREAEKTGKRQSVFCASMADIFEDFDGPCVVFAGEFQGMQLYRTPDGWRTGGWNENMSGETPLTLDHVREELFTLIEQTPWLDWMLLTKRPENIMRMVPTSWRSGFPNHVMMGTSVEDQETANKRIPHLLKIRAKVLYLSCEPLIGSIEFSDEAFVCKRCGKMLTQGTEEDAEHEMPCSKCGCNRYVFDLPTDRATLGAGDAEIDWVICGGESGRNARPMNPDWARGLRDQCQQAGVPFFFKQWGEWLPWDHFMSAHVDDELVYSRYDCAIWDDHKYAWDFRHPSEDELGFDEMIVGKVGKARAGRVLDGHEWNEFPGVEK